MFTKIADLITILLTFGQAPRPSQRRLVTSLFEGRDELEPKAWVEILRGSGARLDVTEFVLKFFEEASGLPFGCARTNDRLRDDLRLNQILWSDWHLDFLEEFQRGFHARPNLLDALDSSKELGEFVVSVSRGLQEFT